MVLGTGEVMPMVFGAGDKSVEHTHKDLIIVSLLIMLFLDGCYSHQCLCRTAEMMHRDELGTLSFS